MRILSRFLLSIFLGFIFLQPLAVKAMAYRDIDLNYKHRQAIAALSDQGLVKGYADGSFRPDQTINRAEALKILVEANFLPTEIERALDEHRAKNHWYVNVPDVRVTDWFGPHVELAFKNNMVRGYSDNTFKPNNAINFAEGLKLILGSPRIDADAEGADFISSKLLYAKRADWFSSYFTYAEKRGLINSNKFYHPAQLMTRGEFAEILYRLKAVESGTLARFVPPSITSEEYRITIPKLDIINQPVGFADPYDGKGALKLLDRFALGHYLSPPGGGSKFVLYGHSWGYRWYKSPYKAVLANIDQLQNGDRIYINYQEKGYVYQVFKSAIIPEKLDKTIMENPAANELVLYTCWPLKSTANRYVVYARPL